MTDSHDELMTEAFRDHRPTVVPEERDAGRDHTGLISANPTPAAATEPPTTGELELEERGRFRHITRDTQIRRTERDDGYDVEYRKLRLERVILVGVWTEGTSAEIEATLAELQALAETAGSDVVEVLYQKRDKPDPGTYIGAGKVTELRRNSVTAKRKD